MRRFFRGRNEAEIEASGNLKWKKRKRKSDLDGHPRAWEAIGDGEVESMPIFAFPKSSAWRGISEPLNPCCLRLFSAS
jgi:hypothetical protein